MKKIILFLAIFVMSLSSCGPFSGPKDYASLVIIRFDNEQYYDYIFGYGNVVFDKELLENGSLNLDSTYLDLAGGFKIGYGIPSRNIERQHYDSGKGLPIMNMTRKECKAYMDKTGEVPEMEVLDSFPKFDLYLFTYGNIGPYQKRMPYQNTQYIGEETYKDFYVFAPEYVPLDIRQQYIDVLDDVIVNNPEDLDRYCTVHIKDSKMIVNRPTQMW